MKIQAILLTVATSLTLLAGCDIAKLQRTLKGQEVCGLEGDNVARWKTIAESIPEIEKATACSVEKELAYTSTGKDLQVLHWIKDTTNRDLAAAYRSGLTAKGWETTGSWASREQDDPSIATVFVRDGEELLVVVEPLNVSMRRVKLVRGGDLSGLLKKQEKDENGFLPRG